MRLGEECHRASNCDLKCADKAFCAMDVVDKFTSCHWIQWGGLKALVTVNFEVLL